MFFLLFIVVSRLGRWSKIDKISLSILSSLCLCISSLAWVIQISKTIFKVSFITYLRFSFVHELWPWCIKSNITCIFFSLCLLFGLNLGWTIIFIQSKSLFLFLSFIATKVFGFLDLSVVSFLNKVTNQINFFIRRIAIMIWSVFLLLILLFDDLGFLDIALLFLWGIFIHSLGLFSFGIFEGLL